MKYVITGAAGNISRPLSEKLLRAGHEVTLIGLKPEQRTVLSREGAQAASGSV